MVELRRAMEALQTKLDRAEERLFAKEGGYQHQPRREHDWDQQSPGNFVVQGSGKTDRIKNPEEQSRELDNLLQRLLSAEEEMKREQELLVALDRKQKLIEAQEEKVWTIFLITQSGKADFFGFILTRISLMVSDF
jgi:hypothetical protein